MLCGKAAGGENSSLGEDKLNALFVVTQRILTEPPKKWATQFTLLHIAEVFCEKCLFSFDDNTGCLLLLKSISLSK